MLLESGLGIGYAQVAPDARQWVSQMVGPRREGGGRRELHDLEVISRNLAPNPRALTLEP